MVTGKSALMAMRIPGCLKGASVAGLVVPAADYVRFVTLSGAFIRRGSLGTLLHLATDNTSPLRDRVHRLMDVRSSRQLADGDARWVTRRSAYQSTSSGPGCAPGRTQ